MMLKTSLASDYESHCLVIEGADNHIICPHNADAVD